MRTFLRRLSAIVLALLLPAGQIVPVFAVPTDSSASNWTRYKAEHLARKALFAATPAMVDALHSAGSAQAAVNLLFPHAQGPDRSAFDAEMAALTATGFNWGDGGHMSKYYQYRLARDPYEAKAKFWLLFEDVFSVNQGWTTITYRDVQDLHDLLYSHTLGNYRTMVKRVLYNNGNPGDYAQGKFLDLLDQADKRYPNENYARELLQLFLMGEYEPGMSKDAGDPRNYEESDVAALAKILTGFRSDSVTHEVSYDSSRHNTSTGVTFLSGASSANFPFYDTASGTLDLGAMETPILGNNGLADNAIDYVFAKRSHQIALFLANRIFRFYAHGNPTRSELDALASTIEGNSFELLPSVKAFLSSDALYSEASMNSLSYKNPVELAIGTAKLLHAASPSSVDPMLNDTSLLSRFGWSPYFPGSVFGRDGFDDNAKWYTTYLQNQWITYANRIAYVTSTGSYSISEFLPSATYPITSPTVVSTSTGNAFTGSVNLPTGTFDVTPALTGTGLSQTLSVSAASVRLPEFTVQTSHGTISVTGGNYDPVARTLSVHSGILALPLQTIEGSVSAMDIQNEADASEEVAQNGNESSEEESGTEFPEPSGFIASPELSGPKPAKLSFPKLSAQDSPAPAPFSFSGGQVSVTNGTFAVSPDSELRRAATPSDFLDLLENRLLLGRKLPSDVRTRIETFLTTTESGAPLAFSPFDATYQRKKIRATISMVLSSPEYVIQTGYDLPSSWGVSGANSPVSSATGKLLIVELWGGFDWLHGVIPKNEYDAYLSKRTLASWSGIAIDASRLTDLGDYYLNNAIAYGSGGSASFRSLYDSGNLRIFNRVGTTKHSRDHDAASKQIASHSSVTDSDAEGVFGRLIKDSGNSVDTISLGNKRPNVFRSGRYANIGPSGAILSNSYVPRAEADAQLSVIRDIAASRSYPASSSDLFQTAIRIDQIASQSKASGGPDGAGWGNVNNLKFLESLLDGNVGKAFYMQADGGYDTHSNQLAPSSNFDPNNVPKDLNYNIGNVASRLTDFFNRVKNRHDVTIIVFSEFGRTNAVNGDVGTDHGQGGGMFVISNNANLVSSLPSKVSGNISIKNAKDNWLGVGIDYRSVYGKIYEALYGVSGPSFFWASSNLGRDVDATPARYALMRTEYRANSDSSVRVDVRFAAEGDNFDTSKSSYLQAWYGTGLANLRQVSQWTVDNSYQKTPDKSFLFPRDWNAEKSLYAYATRLFSNQYAETSYSGTVRLPEVFASSANSLSLSGDSVLRRYDSTVISGRNELSGSGILLVNAGTGAGMSVTSPDGVILETGTGATYVRALTASGTLTWNGGFFLGQYVEPSRFLSERAKVGNVPLRSMGVEKILKIGADTLGVGMELDRSVTLSFTGVSPSSEYRILRSEDGIFWVDQVFPNIFSDASGKLSFSTSRFSYFAAVPVIPVPPPTCAISASPTSVIDGNATTLSWTSTDAAAASLNGNSVAVSGNLSIVPPSGTSTLYRLDVSGVGGSAYCSVTVTSSASSSGGGSSGGNSGSTGGGSDSGGSQANVSTHSSGGGPGGGSSRGSSRSPSSAADSQKPPVSPATATPNPKSANNLSEILAHASLSGTWRSFPAEAQVQLDRIAQSIADGIIADSAGNPRKMARAFHPMKQYLDLRIKKAETPLQKKAVAYLKAKIDSILRQKVARG